MVTSDAQENLVQRAVAGDAVALTLLLTAGRQGLFGCVARRIPADLAGSFDADDLVQDAHAEVFQHITSFQSRGPESFDRWVRTIALRKLRDVIRMRRADKRGGGNVQIHAAGAGVGESVVMLLDLMVGAEKTPSRCVAGGEAVEAVRLALDLLPDDYQQAVSLVYLQGMSVEEAAARMNRTDRAVHNLCYKAKSRLRDLLESRSRFLDSSG